MPKSGQKQGIDSLNNATGATRYKKECSFSSKLSYTSDHRAMINENDAHGRGHRRQVIPLNSRKMTSHID